MSNEEQQPARASGSVPNEYGNRIAWRWSRELPVPLRQGFLTLLYALRAMANASGELRFPDKPIRIQDIAKACGSDEKDARRYLNAAIAAGVVATKGEQKRGKPTLYALVLEMTPDWGAAVHSLESTKRKRPTRKAAPWKEDTEFGGPPPELCDEEFGGPPPELEEDPFEEVRGTAPRMGSGDRPPIGSGDRPPNNPGSSQGSTHDGAEVVVKAEVVGPSAGEPISDNHEDNPTPQHLDFSRCVLCHERLIPDPHRPGRTAHAHCAKRQTA